MQVKIMKLCGGAQVPSYGSESAAGADLYACVDGEVTIYPHTTQVIPTGIAMELPLGYAGFIYARSGLATKKGLAPANKVGVIDSDYRGEIKVALHNHTQTPQTICSGERIAQIVVAPYVTAQFVISDELSQTRRGDGGFGSTGNK